MSNNPLTSRHTHCVEQQRRALGQPATILVVEDDEAVRAFVRVALEHAGHTVVPAADGDHGYREFSSEPDRFALVITDVIMPNKTGPELMGFIRGVRPDLPVIFMSAFTGIPGSNSVEMPSEATLLEKPFSLDQLLCAVDQAIAKVRG